MTDPIKPWTFEPFEAYADPTWTILDPNLSRIVAIFYDEDEADRYLEWRNKKQAKAQRKQAKKKAKAKPDKTALDSWLLKAWS